MFILYQKTNKKSTPPTEVGLLLLK